MIKEFDHNVFIFYYGALSWRKEKVISHYRTTQDGSRKFVQTLNEKTDKWINMFYFG